MKLPVIDSAHLQVFKADLFSLNLKAEQDLDYTTKNTNIKHQ